MMNYKPEYGDMELWLICAAIGSDHDLIDKMQKNPDGSYPVKFELTSAQCQGTTKHQS